jgi:hypothetical protein
MSSKGFSAGLLFIAAAGILTVAAFSCKNSGTNPQPPKCPAFPQHLVPLDIGDPWLRIVSPNGGETYRVGQKCTVKVCSRNPVPNGELCFSLNGTAYTTADRAPGAMYVPPMDGDAAEFADHHDSVVIANIFTVPDSIFEMSGAGTTGVSCISDKLVMVFRSYANPYYPDTTDCYFSIVK